jgi:hypothetical protein
MKSERASKAPSVRLARSQGAYIAIATTPKRMRQWTGGSSMEWSKRLARWASRLLDLAFSNAEKRNFESSGDRPRPATWHDVFLLVEKLEKHGAEYVLIGGYALAFNGLVRQTGDIDIVVKNLPENNRRWIAALCELPAGAAKELVSEADDPFPRDTETENGDSEPGVIRVADEFVVDVMPKACGLSFDDLKPFMHRVERDGSPINILDLNGLKATKQTTRARDIEDLRHIEAALSALQGEVSEHVRTMSRRPLTREPHPPERGIEPRLEQPEGSAAADRRLLIATRIIERSRAEGGDSSIDAETLSIYGSEEILNEILARKAPIADLDTIVRDAGIDLPRHTT